MPTWDELWQRQREKPAVGDFAIEHPHPLLTTALTQAEMDSAWCEKCGNNVDDCPCRDPLGWKVAEI